MSKNQALMSTTLAAAVAAILGRSVLAIAGESQTKYTVSKLDIDGEAGTMKDKSKELFVLLQPTDGDTATVVRLHPKNAAALVKGDETTAGGVKYKLEPLAADVGQAAGTDTGTSTESQSADSTSTEGQVAEQASGTAEAGTETQAAAEGSTTDASASTGESTETAPTAKADKPSKKELAIDMYIEMANAGKERKDIIKAFKDVLGLTQAGANTYYQNCASFKPGWTVRADDAEAGTETQTAAAGAAAGESSEAATA